ncbi:MAG TPA: DUF6011 domain-containing protein [Mycobacterium sp.]|jgi:hypothetical protein|uniref:DUF6011 domain-containing protein n=1 Tax=Mycobacterium sp. TaxID=1785 RepID=UPI002F4283C1
MTSIAAPAAEARCLRPGCCRKLTSAKSLAAGYGPVCLRKIRAAAVEQARADFTADQQAKADELIRDGGIVPLRMTARNGMLFRAVSSRGDETYLVTAGACNCPGGLRSKRPCYQQLAARVLSVASRRSLAKAA